MKFQVVVTDRTDYIIEYKDFIPNQEEEMNKFISKSLAREETVKITIKKWKV